MQVVFFVERENLNKAKDIVGVGSNSLSKKLVGILSKKALGFDEDGAYLAFDAFSQSTVDFAEEILKDNVEKVEEIEGIINKMGEYLEKKLKGKYVVYSIKEEKISETRNLVGTGENSIEKQSITIRNHASLGLDKEGYYLIIDGSEHACKKAGELLKEVAEELEGEEKETVLTKMKEMEDSVLEGFGFIFS